MLSVKCSAQVLDGHLVGGEDPVPHCDSGVLDVGMPVCSVELYPYGQTTFEQ